MKPFMLIGLIVLMLCAQITQSLTLTLPVNQQILTRVTLSTQRLEDTLKYFGTFFQNNYAIYKRVELTKLYLQQLSDALAQYNNVIAGSGNSVVGNKNIIIGSYDNIEGSNNWVFVSQYTGKINGDLLIGQWRIELDKSNLILINPRFAVSFLNESRNGPLRTKYTSQGRQLCKWDKWTHPENQNTDNHWKKYSGYNQWKTNTWHPTTSSLGTSGTINWGSLWGWR